MIPDIEGLSKKYINWVFRGDARALKFTHKDYNNYLDKLSCVRRGRSKPAYYFWEQELFSYAPDTMYVNFQLKIFVYRFGNNF